MLSFKFDFEPEVPGRHHPTSVNHSASSVLSNFGVLSKKWKSILSRVEPVPFVFPTASERSLVFVQVLSVSEEAFVAELLKGLKYGEEI